MRLSVIAVLHMVLSFGGKGDGRPRLNPRSPPAPSPPPSSPYEVMTVMSVTIELVSSEPSDLSESPKRFLLTTFSIERLRNGCS